MAAGVRMTAPWRPHCVSGCHWVHLGTQGKGRAAVRPDTPTAMSASAVHECFLIALPQVLYRWNRQSSASVIETNRTSVELSLPFDEDYIIEIKPFSDGGDGSSSEQIRIPKISSKAGEQVPLCSVSPQEQPAWASCPGGG